MYDFILFENFHLAYNHYKDIVIIAEYLKANGYSVAFADVFQENVYCFLEGIPHIKLKCKKNINIKSSHKKNKGIAFIENSIRQLRVSCYLSRVIDELITQGKNFYVGSYHDGMSAKWINKLSTKKNVFFWGLRSSRLKEYKRRPFSLVGINSYLLWRKVRDNKHILFFVSDELIKNEFLELSIDDNRLIIRPERYVRTLFDRRNNSKNIKLLTIGTIRKSKRVEIVLQALSQFSSDTIEYIIAGAAPQDYEQIIEKYYFEKPLIRRLNYRIPEIQYQKLLKECDFLVLCDEQQSSLVTNGTMNEALLSGTPIIAPNYNPYKHYVEKYKIGILFEPQDMNTLTSAIQSASVERKNLGDNVYKYCQQFLFDKITRSFGEELKMRI